MEPTHGITHYDPDGCFGCRVKTIQYSPTATPTRGTGQTVQMMRDHEKQLDKDLPAFKRMRLEGLEPKHTKGAHEMESKAKVEYEVNSGQLAEKMAKGRDTGGKEWARRAQDAYAAVKRGEIVTP